MIIAKTTMTEMPTSCKECQFGFMNYGLVICPLLKNWIEDWQWAEGMRKQDNCPLEEGEK